MHNDIIETPIFVTSIFHTFVSDIDLPKLVTEVKLLQETTKNCSRSGTGWQSDYFFNYDNTETEKLFEQNIIPIANNIIKLWWNYNKSYNGFEYWYNINHKHSYNKEHNHVGALLSGCFYIKVPEHSGNITFKRTESEVNDISKFINPNQTTPYTNCEYWSNAIKGKLVMFPSYLSHYVGQNMSDEDRICLSFNLM